jgi:hypothetical protein
MKPIRWGALLWVFCLQYFLAEVLAIHGWRGSYSLRQNFISGILGP